MINWSFCKTIFSRAELTVVKARKAKGRWEAVVAPQLTTGNLPTEQRDTQEIRGNRPPFSKLLEPEIPSKGWKWMQSVFHKPPPRPPGYLHGAASQGKPQQQARREGRSPARAACVFYRRQQLVTLHFRNAERAHWELLRAVLQALTPGAGTAVLHTPSARAAQERPQQLQALPCPVCLPAHLQQSTPLSHEHIMPLKHPVPHDYAASSLQLSLWGVANTHTSPKISQNNSVDLSGFFFFFSYHRTPGLI